MQHLDHGILNVPLSKRGNIDSQIDAYKAAQAKVAAAERKAASKLLAEQRIQAKAILAGMSDERIAAMAAKHCTTLSDIRRILRSTAYFQPALLIKAKAPSPSAEEIERNRG
jgi:hypothetical protein